MPEAGAKAAATLGEGIDGALVDAVAPLLAPWQYGEDNESEHEHEPGFHGVRRRLRVEPEVRSADRTPRRVQGCGRRHRRASHAGAGPKGAAVRGEGNESATRSDLASRGRHAPEGVHRETRQEGRPQERAGGRQEPAGRGRPTQSILLTSRRTTKRSGAGGAPRTHWVTYDTDTVGHPPAAGRTTIREAPAELENAKRRQPDLRWGIVARAWTLPRERNLDPRRRESTDSRLETVADTLTRRCRREADQAERNHEGKER